MVTFMKPVPEVIELFFMVNSYEPEISTADENLKCWERKIFLPLKLSDVVIILLINVKMPTIVGISTFISRINLMLIWVENEKV